MAQHDHLFHVKSPFIASIRFTDKFNGKHAPIFIQSLSDQFIVFRSHLGLPILHNDEQVLYEFTMDILGVNFVINGILIRDLTSDNETINTFEGKFSISDSERSNLFKMLNRYHIMLHKLQKEEQQAIEDKTVKKKTVKKPFSRYV